MKRRILALFLAIVMTVGMLPMNAFAAETEETYEYTEPVEQENITEPEEAEEATEQATEPSTEETEAPEETQTEPTEETLPEETEEETLPEETEEETVPEETAEETLPEETVEGTIPEETVEETTEETIAETEEELVSSPIITTLEELEAVALGEYDHYLLAADMELPADWESIDLYGSFDANGYTVTLNGQPLFGTISEDAVVSNVILQGSVSTDYAGSMAVTCFGEIRNSVSFATVESTADWADNGGFVYELDGGSMFNCLFMGNLTVDQDSAGYGMAAKSTGGSVSSCYWLEAELPVWVEEAQNSRQVSGEEVITTAFLNELNVALGEDDLLWGLNENGEPVPGGEEPGVDILPVTLELDEIDAFVSDDFDPDAKVIVTVEGQTLSHGFYIEPTIVSFDEFIDYWADHGVTVAPENITAGGMIDYVIYTNDYTSNGKADPDVNGRGYLSGIEGIRAGKGEARVPDCLADDGITIDQVTGNDLYQFDYTAGGGWMFTEGNWMSNQAMAGHKFSEFGKLYTVNGENFYVVRLQFTIAGLGADLGFDDFGTSYGYHAADKSRLYILYAQLDEVGALDANPEAAEAALAVMTKLDATQQDVNDAYRMLLSPGQAEPPVFTTDLSAEEAVYEVDAKAAPLEVEAAANVGQISYQWYLSVDRYNWVALEGETGTSYLPDTSQKGATYYKCVATNVYAGHISNQVDSTIATVIVGTKPDKPDISRGNLPAATDYSLHSISPTPLKVSPFADPPQNFNLSYQWYWGEAGVTSIDEMYPIPGETTNSYVPDVSEEYTEVYACRVYNTMDGVQVYTDSVLCTVTVAFNVVEISTEDDLHAIQPNGYYVLANDITLTSQWEPINGFCGTLDGDGHTIYNLNVDTNNSYGGGLFGYTMAGATILNLGVEGNIRTGTMNSGTNAAGLVAVAYGSTSISNCSVKADISAGGPYGKAGGIVGEASNCTVENCYFVGTVSAKYESNVGGITGNADGGVIQNCYTTADKAFGSGSGSGTNVYDAGNIPTNMDEFCSLLGDAFVPDTETINDGYPVLFWQGEPADLTALNKTIEKALALNPAAYTVETWNQVSAALKAAQELAAENFPMQAAVDAACEVLNDAINNLERLPVDKTELEADVAEAQKLKKEHYTDESWSVFAEALAAAEKILADQEALQSQVIRAKKSLNEAVGGLVRKPENIQLSKAYETTAKFLKKQTPEAGQTVGGEWSVLGLMRSDYQPGSSYQNSYYTKAVAYINETINTAGQLDRSKSTDNSRMIVALTSIGKDCTNIGGHNLLTALTDMTYLKKQGLNGPIWALIAFDTKPYDIPGSSMTRDTLVNYILDNQIPGGGWNRTVGNTTLDVDITGMALYALAPYYERNAQVKTAVDQTIARLSVEQSTSGGFVYGTSETMESCAQIIVGLSALGIDAHRDERFIKNGNSVIDAFLTYYTDSGEFKHTINGEPDFMATEQALYAMAAYFRNQNGENRLYDMSDINVEDGGDSGDGGDNTETVDKSALEAAIKKAEGLKESDYTKKSWAAAEKTLKEKLTNAKNVLNKTNATQAQVDAAAKALNDIMGKLEKNTGSSGSSGNKGGSTSSKVNRAKLDAEVKKAGKLKKDDYTEESWKPFEAALTNAKNALKSTKATQKQIDEAYSKLVAAEKGLKKATIEDSRKKLETEVKEAEKLVEEDYTARSWKSFASAMSKAQKVLKDEKATQKQLDDAYTKLAAARKALKQSSGDSRSKLEDLVKKCADLVGTNYTAESWGAFAEALNRAKTVLEDKNADEKALEDARAALNAAGRALIPVAGAEAADQGSSIQTLLIVLIVLQAGTICALAGLFFVKRKRK